MFKILQTLVYFYKNAEIVILLKSCYGTRYRGMRDGQVSVGPQMLAFIWRRTSQNSFEVTVHLTNIYILNQLPHCVI